MRKIILLLLLFLMILSCDKFEFNNPYDTNVTIPAPTNLRIVSNKSSITIKWNDNSTGEEGFIISRKIDNGSWNNNYGKVASNITTFPDNITTDHEYFYRVRAYAGSNSSSYSNEIEYSTNTTVTDFDGNIYQTIQIGNQLWMAENLKVTHYRNGDPIPHLTDNDDWTSTTNGAYCYYNNNSANADTYGALYNWYAVDEDDSRGLAPEGWHVPTDDDWQTLVDFLGGSSVAGGKMKETGTAHWISPNTGATNESGFTALPGGYRYYNNGYFGYIGYTAYFWSSTEYDSNNAWNRLLYYDYSGVARYSYYKYYGFSIRCVRD